MAAGSVQNPMKIHAAEVERLAALTHELASHILSARLLVETLAGTALPGQQELLRKLASVMEAEADVGRELRDLSAALSGSADRGGESAG